MNDPETAIDSSEDDASIEASLAANFGEETPTEVADPGPASAQPPAVGGEAPATLEAPKHWSQGDRDLFSKAPRDIQGRWIARESEQQKGLDAKFQEIAAFRREREQLDEMFSPYTRDLELRGSNRTQFIQSLLGAHKFLLEKPQEAFKWLAQEYGIDPSKLNEQPGTPTESAALKEVASLRKELGGFLSKQQNAELQTNLQKVQSFAEAKDEKGQFLHPYFDEVAEDILVLQKAGTKDLDTAYNKAIRMRDDIWEKVSAEKAKAKQAATEAEQKAKIDKAKRAGKTSTTTQADGPGRPQTLEEQLAAGFANYGT